MGEFVLCNIPIYNKTKEEFDNELYKKKMERKANLIDKKCEDDIIITILNKEFTTYSIWKYNQMAGFVEVIIYKNKDIGLKVYLSDYLIEGSRYVWNTSKKHYMKFEQILDLHNYTEGKNNKEIQEDILELLKQLQEWHIPRKKIYFDMTEFEKIVKYTDIKAIIEDVTK